MITCISQGLCNCLYINCCKVNDVQTFRTILQYFISMVYNTGIINWLSSVAKE